DTALLVPPLRSGGGGPRSGGGGGLEQNAVDIHGTQTVDFAQPVKKIRPFSPRHSHLPHTPSRSSLGNTGRDGGQVGRRRRFGWWLTWPPPGEVPSKGAPAATTGGACWTST